MTICTTRTTPPLFQIPVASFFSCPSASAAGGSGQPRLMRLATFLLVIAATFARATDVQVIGEMRRMFSAQDIGANVDLAQINQNPHLYALGPIAGLKGEITALDGQVFTSQVVADRPSVTINPKTKAVFLVYASVSDWHSIDIPPSVITADDLSAFLAAQVPENTRSVFLVRGTAVSGRYHIQNFDGKAEDLTHEAHDKAKVFFEFTNAPVELVGFFTNREGDGGSFVHMGQTSHIHVLSADRKQMGHLESIRMAPGAKLLLPTNHTNR
jgi:alpha-acetolactate decarboxylase